MLNFQGVSLCLGFPPSSPTKPLGSKYSITWPKKIDYISIIQKVHINGSCPCEPVPWYFLIEDVNLPSRELSHILFRQGPFEDEFSLSQGGIRDTFPGG